MKIALIGYGKMGKAIEQIALDQGYQIHAIINDAEELPKAMGADVCIEFTQPSSAFDNLKFCIENHLPVVCGTTAWYDRFEEIKEISSQNDGALLTATNFSIGVNVFFKINRELAKIMNKFPEYKVSMEEVHHLQKLDHPSGTATTLANDIINASGEIDSIRAYLEGETISAENENELSILCKREPEVPGTHSIKYESKIDTLFIEHKAKNRTGFASGAIIAAKWLVGKKGVFTMNDVLGI
jgi:4-hydroxy-tetrahydrodipicolinate reductase